MKCTFLNKINDNNELIIFFNGWGMDEKPFLKYINKNKNFLICYDYQDLDFNLNLIKSYSKILLIAWSMGVFIASKVFEKININFIKKIAINGTLFPINKNLGIHPKIFDLTLNTLNTENLQKFYFNMCGNIENYNLFNLNKPTRDIKSIFLELQSIKNIFLNSQITNFAWDKAIIGLQDNIFKYKNQINSWNNKNMVINKVNAYHYQDILFNRYLNE